MRLIKLLTSRWPFLFILAVWLVLFQPFLFKRLLPIPADIIAGVYYPWLDYKWGFPAGVPVKNALISDVPSLLYPWRSLVIDQMKAGRWPLWNPYYFGGLPLLANFQAAVFSYVNLLFIFLPKALAWSWGVALSPLLTMTAMYLFLKHKKLSSFSALLGGVVFALSGFEIAWLEYNVLGHTALFLPLILWAIDEILEKRSWRWLCLFPILISFQIFTGYIPIVIYTYLLCAFYAAFFYLRPSLRKIIWKNFFWLIGAGLGGILLSAIQLLPGLELILNSIRKVDTTVSASNASYLPVKNLFTLLAPDFFGNPATGNYFGQAFYDNFYFFVGTGTLLLIIYALFFFRKDKNISFWCGIFLFSLCLVFKNPLGLFLEKLFFLSGGVAARALFLTDFSLAILAGLGMERLLRQTNFEKKKIFLSLIFVFSFFTAALLFSFKISLPANRMVAQRNLVIPFFFLSVSSLVLILIGVKKLIKYRSILILFLICLISIQLIYSARKYLPFTKEELLFPRTPVIDFLISEKNKSVEPFRVELGKVIPQNFLMPYGIETTSGSDAMLPKTTAKFLSLLETGRTEGGVSRVYLVSNYQSPLFPLLNTKYILAKKSNEKGIFTSEGKPPPEFTDPRYRLVHEDKTVQVYQDSHFLSRAFLISEFPDAALAAKDGLVPTEGEVVWRKNEPNEILLEVQSKTEGFLCLSNNYFPGWEAYVNGEKTAVFPSYYSFQAIKVPPGVSQVKFLYSPRSFRLGALSSAVSLILLLSLLLFWRFRRGKS